MLLLHGSLVLDLAAEIRLPDRSQTLVPLLTIIANLMSKTIPLLNLSFELFSAAIYNDKIIISELPPLFVDHASSQLPISFQAIPLHCEPPSLSPRYGGW